MFTLADLSFTFPAPLAGEDSPDRTARNISVTAVLAILPLLVRHMQDGTVSKRNVQFTTPYDVNVPTMAVQGRAFVHTFEGRLRVRLRLQWGDDNSNALRGDRTLTNRTTDYLQNMMVKLGVTVKTESEIDGPEIVIDFPL